MAYEYTDEDGDKLMVTPSIQPDRVFLNMSEDGGHVDATVHVLKVDVPTVAAELLKAAGRSELAEMIEAVEAERRARAEREAAAQELQERRDAVTEYLGWGNWQHISASGRKAITRIIELEDGK